MDHHEADHLAQIGEIPYVVVCRFVGVGRHWQSQLRGRTIGCAMHMKLRFTLGAEMARFPRHNASRSLYDRWLAVIVALCTKMMDRFSASFRFLKRVEERSGIIPLQFVALLLSFPAFQGSHFFFKLAYALNQRRLLRLRISQGGLYR